MAVKSPYDTSSYTMTQGTTKKKKKTPTYDFTKTPTNQTGATTSTNSTMPSWLTSYNAPTTPSYTPSKSTINRDLTPKETSAVAGLTAPFDSLANRASTETYNLTPGTTFKPTSSSSGSSGGYVPPPVTQQIPQQVPQQVPQEQTQKGQFDYNAEVQKGIQAYIDGLPKVPEYQPYQGGLDPQIMETLNKIRNYKQFDYDPANDEALNVAQDQAIQRVRQDMARRGRVFDTYAGTQEQQAAQGLIPDYYRFARQGYESDRGYQGQVLNAIQGVDQAQYGRYGSEYDRSRQGALQGQQDYNTAYNVGQQGAQGEYQRGLTKRTYQDQQTQDMEKQEVAEFGTPLSDQARDYRQTFLDMPQDIKAKLMPLSEQPGGFATSIIKMRAEDQSNPMLPMLEAMRANKVLSDPELLKQYGSEYGMQTGAIGAMGDAAEQQKTEQLQTETINKLEVLKMKVQNRKYEKEITEIQAQVEKIGEDAKRIQAQTGLYDKQKAEKEIDIQIKKLEKGAMPKILKQEMQILLAEEKQKLASAYSSTKSGQLSGARTATEEATRQGKKDIQAATIKNKNASTTKLNKEVATKSKTNPVLKWVNDNYAKTEYETTIDGTKSTGKKTLSTLSESDKQLLIESLVDQYNNIENPTTTGKAQVDNIGEVIDIFNMEEEYLREIGAFAGPIDPNKKWR